jgi:hypothetical protein
MEVRPSSGHRQAIVRPSSGHHQVPIRAREDGQRDALPQTRYGDDSQSVHSRRIHPVPAKSTIIGMTESLVARNSRVFAASEEGLV